MFDEGPGGSRVKLNEDEEVHEEHSNATDSKPKDSAEAENGKIKWSSMRLFYWKQGRNMRRGWPIVVLQRPAGQLGMSNLSI